MEELSSLPEVVEATLLVGSGEINLTIQEFVWLCGTKLYKHVFVDGMERCTPS